MVVMGLVNYWSVTFEQVTITSTEAYGNKVYDCIALVVFINYRP